LSREARHVACIRSMLQPVQVSYSLTMRGLRLIFAVVPNGTTTRRRLAIPGRAIEIHRIFKMIVD